MSAVAVAAGPTTLARQVVLTTRVQISAAIVVLKLLLPLYIVVPSLDLLAAGCGMTGILQGACQVRKLAEFRHFLRDFGIDAN
jgi:hypothetical protein